MKLESLNLAQNSLLKIPGGLASLKRLNLSHIASDDGLFPAQGMHVSVSSNNSFRLYGHFPTTNITFGSFCAELSTLTNLETLDLSWNSYTSTNLTKGAGERETIYT